MRFWSSAAEIHIDKVIDGLWSRVYTYPLSGVSSTATVAVKATSTKLKVWVDSSLKIDTSESELSWGGVALGGYDSKFDNLKVGYDTNNDGDLSDAGDDLAIDEDFASTSDTVTHDKAGNLIDDGTFQYVYDAWHRLVKVNFSADSGAVTVQTAEFDATGRRLKKVVTKSGDLDATTRFFYDGHKIVETRLGTQTTYHQQFIHGTRYIDELVMIRIKDKGDLYVHQDANWNIVALTDLGGRVVERYVYSPYGQVTVYQETSFGDYDGDGDVDQDDKDAMQYDPGPPEIWGVCRSGTPSGACRILDFDFDNDVDDTDETLFDALPQGLARHPSLTATGVHQPFAHQGLLFEPEIESYQNRARQYAPSVRRFLQRSLGASRSGLSAYVYVPVPPETIRSPIDWTAGFPHVKVIENDPDAIIVKADVVFWGKYVVENGVSGAEELNEYWNRPQDRNEGLRNPWFSRRCKTVDFQFQQYDWIPTENLDMNLTECNTLPGDPNLDLLTETAKACFTASLTFLRQFALPSDGLSYWYPKDTGGPGKGKEAWNIGIIYDPTDSFRSELTHEVGHALGFSHHDDPDGVNRLHWDPIFDEAVGNPESRSHTALQAIINRNTQGGWTRCDPRRISMPHRPFEIY